MGFIQILDFWIKVSCKGGPLLPGIKEPPCHREEGKLRSEDYNRQGMGHGLLNSFSLGKKKKIFYAQGAYFLNKHSWF